MKNVEVSDEDFAPENVRRSTMVSEGLLSALDEWRGLTEKQREQIYRADLGLKYRADGDLALRLLKAAGR